MYEETCRHHYDINIDDTYLKHRPQSTLLAHYSRIHIDIALTIYAEESLL